MKGKMLLAGICLVLCGLLVPHQTASAEELEEHTAYLTDDEFRYVIEESMEDIYNIMSDSYSMSWTIKKNRRRTTAFFVKYANSTISIGVELSMSGKAGIIGNDGIIRYVEGTSLYKSFAITTSQTYAVFIQNDHSTSMTSSGYYYR